MTAAVVLLFLHHCCKLDEVNTKTQELLIKCYCSWLEHHVKSAAADQKWNEVVSNSTEEEKKQ